MPSYIVSRLNLTAVDILSWTMSGSICLVLHREIQLDSMMSNEVGNVWLLGQVVFELDLLVQLVGFAAATSVELRKSRSIRAVFAVSAIFVC
jgi:hypothetical protein